MLNYPVDDGLLDAYVPRGTELDTWNGRPYVSLVGFMFLRTKVKGWPIPYHRNFEEVNLRFYVRRHVKGETRRGVVFIREIVRRRAIAWVANALYNENYVNAHMVHTRAVDSGLTQYECGQGESTFGFKAFTEGEAKPLSPGSAEEFFAEHYWGYARRRDGSTNEYRVDHPPWKVWTTRNATAYGNTAAFYDDAFAEIVRAEACSAFVADGSRVQVFPAIRIP